MACSTANRRQHGRRSQRHRRASQSKGIDGPDVGGLKISTLTSFQALLRMSRPESETRRVHALLHLERCAEGMRRPRWPVQAVHGRIRLQDIAGHGGHV